MRRTEGSVLKSRWENDEALQGKHDGREKISFAVRIYSIPGFG